MPVNEMVRVKVALVHAPGAAGVKAGAETATKTEPSIQLVGFDARMPEHNHGMMVKPRLTKQGDGWIVDGVKLHMPGDWEFRFDLLVAGQKSSLVFHRVI